MVNLPLTPDQSHDPHATFRLVANRLATTWRGWLACVALLALVGCGSNAAAPQSKFLLIDGSTTTLSAMRGQVVLVNFWATSCTSCVAEMPELIETHQRYKDKGYETVAVAMSYDPATYVLNFANTRNLPFKVALDQNDTLAKAWGDVKLTPTTFIVNKRGEIVKSFVGAPNFESLHALIEDLLAQPA
jgi:peroxiredoxin